MPTYNTRCGKCGNETELFCSYESLTAGLVTCECGGIIEKTFTKPNNLFVQAHADLEPRRIKGSVVSTRGKLRDVCDRNGLVCPEVHNNLSESVGFTHELAMSGGDRDGKRAKLAKHSNEESRRRVRQRAESEVAKLKESEASIG